MTQSYVPGTLHPAGQILMEIGHLGLTVTESEVTGSDDQRAVVTRLSRVSRSGPLRRENQKAPSHLCSVPLLRRYAPLAGRDQNEGDRQEARAP